MVGPLYDVINMLDLTACGLCENAYAATETGNKMCFHQK